LFCHNAFADGISRSVPEGHYPGFTYQWLFNNNPITSGVNDITLNNNILFIHRQIQRMLEHIKQLLATVRFLLKTGNSVLEIETLEPELLSPANNSTDQPIEEVTFTWVPALVATAYILQVSTDPNFNTILVEVDTTGTSYKLMNLQYYTDYTGALKDIIRKIKCIYNTW
jgi:hypothetical protein